jgi:hypothetical protein
VDPVALASHVAKDLKDTDDQAALAVSGLATSATDPCATVLQSWCRELLGRLKSSPWWAPFVTNVTELSGTSCVSYIRAYVQHLGAYVGKQLFADPRFMVSSSVRGGSFSTYV